MKRLLLVAIATVVAILPTTAAHAAHSDVVTIGTSVAGREIRAERLGPDTAATVMVVIGQMHGDEPAGRRVVQALRGASLDGRTAIWVVTSMNPDGHVRRSRTNARKVDLNRNFPTNWRRSATSGARAASEPETKAMVHWLTTLQPDAVISLHQPFDVVDLTHARSREAGRALARWMGVPARIVDCDGPCRGTLTQWIDRRLGAIALTVELDDRASAREITRTVGAISRLGTWLADRAERAS